MAAAFCRLGMRHVLALFLLVFLLVHQSTSSSRHPIHNDIVDVGIDGEVLHSDDPDVQTTLSMDHSQDQPLMVTFVNGLAQSDIVVYWISADGDREQIAWLAPAEKVEIETFRNHRFDATIADIKPQNSIPDRIVVRPGTHEYSFYPKSTQLSTVDRRDNIFGPRNYNFTFAYLNQPSNAVNVRFRSLAPMIDMWYDNGKASEPSFQGSLKLGQESNLNTYEGHTFFMTVGPENREIARYTISSEDVLILVEDPDDPPPADMLEHNENERRFSEQYKAEHGIPWRHHYGADGPRDPPTLFMWPADQIGDVHKVISDQSHWYCEGSPSECQSTDPIDLTLEVIDTAPRAFVIRNFLTDFEVAQIIHYATPLLDKSLVGDDEMGGALDSETRTSMNAWVSRGTSAITETLFRRAADLLNIDESILHSNRAAEDMQVVHYLRGERYDSHHDWGVNGYAESRFITLLLYLTDQEGPHAGGETSFPKGAGGKGFKVHPGKGSAVLFYNLLEDGNADDLSLHASLPVRKGEKWLANFWVWDPRRRD